MSIHRGTLWIVHLGLVAAAISSLFCNKTVAETIVGNQDTAAYQLICGLRPLLAEITNADLTVRTRWLFAGEPGGDFTARPFLLDRPKFRADFGNDGEMGYDGETFYYVSKNILVDGKPRPEVQLMDRVPGQFERDPGALLNIDPKLIEYLAQRSSKVSVQWEPGKPNRALLTTTLGYEDIFAAMNKCPASCTGGCKVRLWVERRSPALTLPLKLEMLAKPIQWVPIVVVQRKWLVGGRDTWTGWKEAAPGIWLPDAHRAEAWGDIEALEGGAPPTSVSEDRFDLVRLNVQFPPDTFKLRIPPGFRVIDYRKENASFLPFYRVLDLPSFFCAVWPNRPSTRLHVDRFGNVSAYSEPKVYISKGEVVSSPLSNGGPTIVGEGK